MNMDDIKQANARAGFYFFSPESLRFFSSRLGQNVYGVWFGSHATNDRRPGGQYFVTSEKFDWSSPRLYTVRRFDPETSRVAAVSGFQEYATGRMARGRAVTEMFKEQKSGVSPV